MKGRIFTAQEVQAIIAGNKTMFREVIKNANYDSPVHSYKDWENNGLYYPVATLVDENGTQFTETQYSFDGIRCPYQVGQKIFVKESFAYIQDPEECVREGEPCEIHYKADYDAQGLDKRDAEDIGVKFLSASKMHEWASRLNLQIKEIRVERLQDISGEDAIAEAPQYNIIQPFGNKCPIDFFKTLWNSTHKKPEEKFEASPWVWAIQFEVVK
jgi:hypothetical protein